MDETYIKVRGEDRYLHRAVDTNGDTVDFPFTARRDLAAVNRAEFLDAPSSSMGTRRRRRR